MLLQAVAEGQSPYLALGPPLPQSPVLFPGSFNPIHEGHQEIARYGMMAIGQHVHFELSIENVDKPPLAVEEVQRRLSQFDLRKVGVVITRAPRFVDKAAMFPDATFLMGTDTLRRLLDDQYCDGAASHRKQLEAFCDLARQVIVFGRKVITRESRSGEGFESLGDFSIPQCLAEIAVEVTESEFRRDITSTELREGGCDSEPSG